MANPAGARRQGELNAFQRSVHDVALNPETLHWIFSRCRIGRAASLSDYSSSLELY
jgi:hypothetical protein